MSRAWLPFATASSQANGTPASTACASIAWASCGLVAKATSPGMPAARHRSRS